MRLFGILWLGCNGKGPTTTPMDGGPDASADADADADADSDADVDTAPAPETGETGVTSTGEPRIDRVYAVDPSTGTWTQPVGLGGLIASQLSGSRILFTPISLTPASLTLRTAVGDLAGQMRCATTTDTVATTWADPQFAMAGASFDFVVGSSPVALENATVSGRFFGAGGMEQVAIAGEIDTAAMGALFGLGNNPSAVCDLVAAFGVVCGACTATVSPYCLDVAVTNLTAPYEPRFTVIPRTEADVANDPACP